jgi:hypothetical protein
MPPTAKPTMSKARHPYKVFVFSTYLDNTERRQIVQEAITTVGIVWHGMGICLPGGESLQRPARQPR